MCHAKLFLLFALTSRAIHAFPQSGYNYVYAKNAVFGEVASKSAAYSVNYDRLFRVGDELCYSYRAGLSYYRSRVYVPMALNAFTGPETAHHTEACAILMPSISKSDPQKGSAPLLHLIGTLGYRYQKLNAAGLLVKAGIGPMISVDPKRILSSRLLNLYGYGSIAVGYCF